MENERIGLPADAETVGAASAAHYTEREFGGPVRSSTRIVNVATSITPVLGNNPRRVFWMIQNLGVNDGNLILDPSASTTQGVILGARGGFASKRVRDDGETVQEAVFGVQNVATGAWYVHEVMGR